VSAFNQLIVSSIKIDQMCDDIIGAINALMQSLSIIQFN